MAVCDVCDKEMLEADSCTATSYEISGTTYARIPWGKDEGRRCGDCNVAPGGYHHPGCDIEVCPKCGGQYISCDCDVEDIYEAGEDPADWLF